MFKASGPEHFKLGYDKPLSNCAFNYNVRRYNEDISAGVGGAAAAATATAAGAGTDDGAIELSEPPLLISGAGRI